jgi:chromosome segregation ATPase
MDGLLGWMTEMERRQGKITYFGGAAVSLAIGAAVLAILLALFTEADSVTEEDFQDLQEKVSGTTELELKGLSETIGSLDQRIEHQERQLRQGGEQVGALRSELQTLQGQLRRLRAAAQQLLQ